MTATRVTVIAGGVGAARFLTGLVAVVDPADVTAIVNVGDDLELHGLHISPDLDTVTYTLAGAIDRDRGWGLADESWHAMDMLRHLGGEAWFRLGDRDLGTHLYRTHRLAQGTPLSQVTAEITRAWGIGIGVVPVTDDRLRTFVTLADGSEIDFQSYFVGHQHAVEVRAVRFDGADAAGPAPGVLDAIGGADVVVIAPSNPIVSIDPVLAVAGVRDTLADRRSTVVGISPIIGGAAIKGPADRMLRELGHQASAVGVAEHYRDLAGTFVVDEVDRSSAAGVEALGIRAVVTDTVMQDPHVRAALARTVLESTS